MYEAQNMQARRSEMSFQHILCLKSIEKEHNRILNLCCLNVERVMKLFD